MNLIGNFSTERFSLAANEHFAYNMQTQTFFSVKKGIKLANHCTNDLGKMTQIVNEWFLQVQQKPLTENLPTIRANIDTFNQICDYRIAVHNSKIENSFLLSLVDRITSFITRGRKSLKIREQQYFIFSGDNEKSPIQCNRKELLGYRFMDVVKTKFSMFFDHEQIDELKALAATAEFLLNPEEFERIFFQNPLSLFDQFTYNQKHAFGKLLQVLPSTFNFDWKTLKEETRGSLLEHVVEVTTLNESYPIEKLVYGACLTHYNSLTWNEKRLLESLIEQRSLPKSREGSILLLRHLSEDRAFILTPQGISCEERDNTQFQDKYEDVLNEILDSKRSEDIALALEVLQKHSNKLFKFLSKKCLFKLFKQFKIEKNLDAYPKLILPLCSEMLKREPDEDEREEICSFLQDSKVFKFTSSDFRRLTTEPPLSIEFNKDPDRFLAKASEEQLDLYYKPWDQNKKDQVNKAHLTVRTVEKMIVPPIPEGVKVDVSDLIKMFEQINFKKKNQPDYVDPQKLFNDGTRVSPNNLRQAFERFIRTILTRAPLIGAPNKERNPEAHDTFYTNLTRYLEHIVLALHKRSVADRSAYLISLAGLGYHCGIRYMVGTQDVYCQLTGENYSVEAKSLTAGILDILQKRRAQILKKIINDITPDVHCQMAILKNLSAELGISEGEAYGFNDPFGGGVVAEFFLCRFAKQKFYDEYTPTLIINEVMKHIEGIPGHPKTITQEFRDLLNEWFNENMPDENRAKSEADPEEYSFLNEVYQMDVGRIRRQWIVYLLEEIGVLSRPTRWTYLYSSVAKTASSIFNRLFGQKNPLEG